MTSFAEPTYRARYLGPTDTILDVVCNTIETVRIGYSPFNICVSVIRNGSEFTYDSFFDAADEWELPQEFYN